MELNLLLEDLLKKKTEGKEKSAILERKWLLPSPECISEGSINKHVQSAPSQSQYTTPA